jgi:anti-sigma B factor antagonist
MSDVIDRIERGESYIAVYLRGEIDLHRTPDLHRRLIEVCLEKPTRLILDLSGVEYVDSSGVGTLVDIYRRVDAAKGTLVLVSPTARVYGVLEITRLDKFFTIADTFEQAKTL